jgi:hypothetical protein
MEDVKISEMLYADDMVIIAKDEKTTNDNLKIYNCRGIGFSHGL